jgi:phage-related tail fiber protein
MSTYFALLTALGEAKLANAAALGGTLKLTHMGVGDADDQAPTPDRAQTMLRNERRRAPLNRLTVDPANPSQIIVEQVLPENVGGWWIREIGVYDEEGMLCAVANCPPSYKPQLSEGSGRTQVVRMVLLVSSSSTVELKIDPAVVLATRGYVEECTLARVAEHGAHPDPHPQYHRIAANLSDVANPAIALNNLGGTPLAFVTELAPPGEVAHFATLSAPAGWLKANGALVSRTTYAALFLAIGARFGAGDGTTTFALPDLRGEFIRGFDDVRGIDSGRKFGSWQKGSILVYDTNLDGLWGVSSLSQIGATSQDEIGVDAFSNTDYPNAKLIASNLSVGPVAMPGTAGNQGYSGAVRPRNIALLACIKY